MKAILVSILTLLPMALPAQTPRDVAPLKQWVAPLFWHPTPAESRIDSHEAQAASPFSQQTQTLANSLLFVAMTPCRVVDTRQPPYAQPGLFGPPSLVNGVRTFPIPSSTTCSIPASALAYSFNITVVPPGLLGYITVYPAGQPQPNASTLNDYLGTVVANAAIVPAGANGAVSVYANNPTDLIIDINGYYALPSDLTSNTAIGSGVLIHDTSGANNTGVGVSALTSNTTGNFNTANGVQSLYNNTTGSQNAGNGSNTLFANTTGSQNTANGDSALLSNSTGSQNTASGAGALQANVSGLNNTAIGFSALNNNLFGSSNIAIGSSAATNVSNLNSNNIHIGNQGVFADSAVIKIGTAGTQSSFFAAGIRGVTTGQANAVDVFIDSNGQLGTVNSSRRFKEDIQDMGDASSGLLRLRPVTFRYKQPYEDGSQPLDYGLIAEEVAEVYPDLAVKGSDGQIETVQYHKLNSMLLNEVQKQHQRIEEQQDELAALKARLAVLEKALEKSSDR